MKEDSKWPLGSYIATIIGAAAVLILKLYASQKGGSHLTGGRMLPILLGLSPFLFGMLVLNFNTNPRALKFLSLAIILQAMAAIGGSVHAIFKESGLEASLELGMVPLYQFAIIGVAAVAVQFIEDKQSRGIKRNK